MGNTRRIRKALNKSVCLAKTGLVFGGSEVLLAVDNPIDGKVKAEAFRRQTIIMAQRSGYVNIRDIMTVSLVMRERMVDGKPIWAKALSEAIWN